MNQFGSILDLYLSSFPFVSHAQGCESRVKILRLRLGIGLSSSLRPDLGLRTLLLEMGKLFSEHRIGIARTQPLGLANKYGPIMHLKVGQVSIGCSHFITRIYQRVCCRAKKLFSRSGLVLINLAVTTSSNALSGVFFNPYNHFWRQMRRIC